MQIQEQADAFSSLLLALRYRNQDLDLRIINTFNVPIQVSIGIRFNCIDCKLAI
jgi:hypothetical protein